MASNDELGFDPIRYTNGDAFEPMIRMVVELHNDLFQTLPDEIETVLSNHEISLWHDSLLQNVLHPGNLIASLGAHQNVMRINWNELSKNISGLFQLYENHEDIFSKDVWKRFQKYRPIINQERRRFVTLIKNGKMKIISVINSSPPISLIEIINDAKYDPQIYLNVDESDSERFSDLDED